MCRGLATRFYRYRSGGVVVHAYQTPGTLSHLTYAIGALLCVEFVSLKSSLSLSFLFLSAINHMILVVEYGKKNCKGWILFDGKHMYLLVYSSKHIYKHVCYHERLGYCFYNVIHMHNFLYCISSMTHWVPKGEKY